MSENGPEEGRPEEPECCNSAKVTRGALQIAAGAIPFAGGVLSAAAGYWSERDQERVNRFLKAWAKMLEDELREKQRTIAGIVSRLDLQDEKIADRVSSKEYQSLLKKAFREWAGAESLKKQEMIRNIMANAAATDLTSDDVVRLFLVWMRDYTEFHFAVVGEIFNNDGITRGEIWRRLGKGQPREDSSEADLFKLLIRDLSTGGVIRQHRERDYYGNFVKKKPATRRTRGATSDRMKSAFDHEDGYELTALGRDFVHYAMTELPPKLDYNEDSEPEANLKREDADAA